MLYNIASGLGLQYFSHNCMKQTPSSVKQSNRNLRIQINIIIRVEPDPIAHNAVPSRMLYNTASGLGLQYFSHKCLTQTSSSVKQSNRTLRLHINIIIRVDPDPNNADPNRNLYNTASGLGLQYFSHKCLTHISSSVKQSNRNLRI